MRTRHHHLSDLAGSLRLLILVALALLGACSTAPIDPATRWLAPGEVIRLRIAAQLLHGHDMSEPAYGPEGYQPIPTFDGELLLTESRLLFLSQVGSAEPSSLSIPFAAISRARPSKTQLLHYIVVWDSDNHPDSFLVGRQDVQELHRQVGAALMNSMQQRKPHGQDNATRRSPGGEIRDASRRP